MTTTTVPSSTPTSPSGADAFTETSRTADERVSSIDLNVTGMTCASCVRRVERALTKVQGVASATVNLATETATVQGSPSAAELVSAVEHAGYHVSVPDQDSATSKDLDTVDAQAAHARRFLVDIGIGAALSAPVFVLSFAFANAFPRENLLLLALALPAWAYVGRSFHIGAVRGISHRSVNMDTLVSLGSSAAFLYSVWVTFSQANGITYFDSAAVIVTLILLGKYLEAHARGQAGAAIKRLAGLSAKSAVVLVSGAEVEVPLSRVAVGDVLLVRPGSKVPVDGVVMEVLER